MAFGAVLSPYIARAMDMRKSQPAHTTSTTVMVNSVLHCPLAPNHQHPFCICMQALYVNDQYKSYQHALFSFGEHVSTRLLSRHSRLEPAMMASVGWQLCVLQFLSNAIM